MKFPILQKVAELENCVLTQDNKKAVATLNEIIPVLFNRKKKLTIQGDPEAVEKHERMLFTRLASAISYLVTPSDFKLDFNAFDRLCIYQELFREIFSVSGFGSSSFILEHIIVENAEDKNITFANLFKILPFSSLDSMPSTIEKSMEKFPSRLMVPWGLSLLSTRAVLTERASRRYKKLLSLTDVLAEGELTPVSINSAAISYMNCSYIDFPKKHQIKSSLNKLFVKYMNSQGVKSLEFGSRQIKTRPKMIVMVEQFKSSHAMFRCYRAQLEQLKNDFELIAISQPDRMDDVSRKIFHDSKEIALDLNDISEVVNAVTELNPDMIYFPSIGMSHFNILLSNLRLAPIQFFSGGHPATSHSEHMDYFLFEEDTFGDPDCFSETVLLSRQGPKHSAHPDLEEIMPFLRENLDVIRIAVPANRLKLNYDFLETCRNIVVRAGKKVEFNFYPNCIGLEFSYCSKVIPELVPGAVVHPNTRYQIYLESLNQCDLALCSYPFGLSNGIVDCAMVGVPCVTLDGPETHSHIDTGLIKRMGLPDYLSTKTKAELEDLVLRLVSDDEARLSLARAVIDSDPQKVFFAEKRDEPPTDFYALVKWIYHGHEKIQQQKKHMWTYGDRQSFKLSENG